MCSLNLAQIEVHQNEPKMRTGTKGFIAVPSVGMRLAPEILILELFRDVFFESDSPEQSKTQELDPEMRDKDTNAFVLQSIAERATVAALRNKRKQSRQSREKTFYAPAYPSLASNAWLSRKRERVISRLLFEGAFSQYLWPQGETSQEGHRLREGAVDSLIRAMLGTPKPAERDDARADILAAAVRDVARGIDIELARKRLMHLCGPSDTVLDRLEDELATRICEDLLAVCRLEESLPRLLWLRVLMTHLRFALPMWLLAQMRVTVIVHAWLLEAIDGQRVPSGTEIMSSLAHRNRNLIHPTLTPTREVFSTIREYMKSRVELNVLLYCLEQIMPAQVANKRITVQRSSSGWLPLSELLDVARASREAFLACPEWRGAPSARVFLRRHCETYRAWRDPLNKGQGKNIEEFLRILYRPEMGDDVGGHLLLRQGRGDTAGFRVFPGQLLLQTIAALAASAKRNSDPNVAGGGKLALEDIEEHFAQYGIEFAQAADARPLLMQELQALGLLSGSPDAGSSVAVFCPF